MSKFTASAPGKIVVCGEYAVLGGAPAISMAINCRARVTVQPAAGNFHTLRANGVVNGDYQFSYDDIDEFFWNGNAGVRLVEETWRELGLISVPPLQLHIDSSEFGDTLTNVKFGFGSSAAVAVALSAALGIQTQRSYDWGRVAAAAHRRQQEHRGSGVDVATSYCGGLIEYRMRSAEVPTALQWPASIDYRVMWSGRAADTAEKLGRLSDLATGSASMRELIDRATAVAEHWAAADGAPILQSLAGYVDALIEFDTDHDVGIFDAGHRELLKLARDTNVIYKPCGAGGGDTGMVLTDSNDERLDEFLRQAAELGYAAIDVILDGNGVSVREVIT